MYQIKEQLISRNRHGKRKQQPALGIVIHSTADPGATAQDEYNYYNSRVLKGSAHYFADWEEIIQTVPEAEIAWHAGATANSRYISIEMCEPDGTDYSKFEEVWNRTVWFVANTCIRNGWSTKDNVFSHYGCTITFKDTDHTDPIGFLEQYDKTWDELLEAIDAEIAKQRNGGKKKMKNLILCNPGPDERAAGYLADHLKSPKDNLSTVDQKTLDSAEVVYVVGSKEKPVANCTNIVGIDRYDTCRKVLDIIQGK